MVTKYIHLGYPKNLSTSLQRDFFPKHKEILHLGIGCNDDNLGYIDDDVSLAVEFHLRYSKDFIYKTVKDKIKNRFEHHFKEAEKNKSIKAVGISGEHMGFNYTPDNIDVTTKARRLYDIFGSDTKIIMIIRNQIDLIQSLYNECIRVGYPKSYAEYIEYISMFYERNFASDFLYNDAYETYANLWGEDNICVIPIEAMKQGASLRKNETGECVLLKKITDHLNISYQDIDLGHFNKALDDAVLIELRKLNAEFPHDLGNVIYGTAESHRIIKRYHNDLEIDPPYEAVKDVLKKRDLIGQAMKLAEGRTEKMDYSCNPEHIKQLEDLYRRGNVNLSKKLGIDLAAYGYPI